jgi:Skp family chaperone for outer membrane proteins
MKLRLKALLLAFTLVSTVLPVVAQDLPKPENAPRFAFFTLGLLVENSVKAKKIFTELEATQKTLNDKLKAKADEGQKVQQQLQSASLSDQGREQLKKQLRDLDFDYKKLQEDSQGEFNKTQQKVLGEIYKQVGPIIQELAKEQKLQVVFSGESAQAGQLIQWADDAWIKTFTLEVARRLDASGPAKPASAPAKPAPAPAAKPGAPVTAKPVVTNP